MDVIALLLWLASYSLITLINSSTVTRRRDGDQFETKACTNCTKQAANCTQKDTKCCTRCHCNDEMTFYKNVTQMCVNPNRIEGCEYYFRRSRSKRSSVYKHERKFHWFDLKGRDGDIDIGVIKHERYKIHGKDCAVVKQQYWNLTKWDGLPTVGKKKANFTIPHSRGPRTVKVRFPSRNTSVYQGLLIKLEIQCDGVDKSSQSSHPCAMFKTLGEKIYIASTEEEIVKPPSGKHKKKSWVAIIGIIVGILLVITVAIISILYCRRKKRKDERRRDGTLSGEGLLMRGESDPNYHKPSAFCGRKNTEDENNPSNAVYLQPINDIAASERNGNAKQKDPNYDYPDLNLELAKAKKNSKKPIYAEPEKPVYSDPENVIVRPTRASEVVGVPGYQPPRGPVSPPAETSSTAGTYSTLDTSSMGDSNAYQTLLDPADMKNKPLPKVPSSPKYAVVSPDPPAPEPDEDDGEVQI